MAGTWSSHLTIWCQGWQDGQCTYNVRFRCVCATIVAIEINKYSIFWTCICRCWYPACNAHAPYCHLWPALLYNIFPHYLINSMIFGKTIMAHKMCVLIFSTTYVWNFSHSGKNWARYDQKCILVFMQSTLYSCPVLMKLEFPQHIFEKYPNIKFHDSPSSGSWVVPCGQRDGRTDRHDEADSIFLQFCECTFIPSWHSHRQLLYPYLNWQHH